ncbi:Spy/CpxP family protein refolding chaperone [Oscillatoria sp. FACHB-1406]|uniref:Spy/CpxP family protein refolding chaperone n=1 Tax=Oscillatoria sp. FACHB-1406 TaxID=2692846 RepID=UPI001684D7B2|nr:Spy/CpxP family protein refolding chaperone [Oscillatoria sp. FACHB-1406]MBD2578662.1 Spy/CpxP family protein refolding chaperone [Oscillatoria sp. FACHB-1406]
MRPYEATLGMLLLIGSGSAAFAQLPSAPPSPPEFVQNLGLTPEQIQQIESIREQARPKLAQLDRDLKAARQTLETLMSSANATEAQIREQHRQVEALRQQLSETTIESRLAIREVLTPEQRVGFEAEMQRLRQSVQNRPVQNRWGASEQP